MRIHSKHFFIEIIYPIFTIPIKCLHASQSHCYACTHFIIQFAVYIVNISSLIKCMHISQSTCYVCLHFRLSSIIRYTFEINNIYHMHVHIPAPLSCVLASLYYSYIIAYLQSKFTKYRHIFQFSCYVCLPP